MVHDDDHWMFHSGEIMMPSLQSLDDGKEFPVIDVVILFHRGEGHRVIGTGMEISVGIFLHEYPSSGSEGGVSHDEEWLGSIQHSDYWGREKGLLEFNKCVILFLSP